jgi:hypothetical protein
VDDDLCFVGVQFEDHSIFADPKSIEAHKLSLERSDIFMSERILKFFQLFYAVPYS